MVASFSTQRVSASDYRWLLQQMRELDKDMFNQMRREMRKEIRPFSRQLSSNIPSTPMLSGLSPRNPYASQSLDQRAPWLWRKPRVSIDVGGRSKPQKGKPSKPIARIKFTDKRPYAVFSILERRKGGRIPDQVSAVGFKFGDRGRFVIPQFYKRQGEMAIITRRILVDFANRVNIKIGRRFS